MTLSPCRTLQNVIHTRKCVPCRESKVRALSWGEYAKPNRCVFKCFAKVSKPSREEDLQPTGKEFQLLGPADEDDVPSHTTAFLLNRIIKWNKDFHCDTQQPISQLLQFPGSGNSRNDPRSGKCFPGSNSWSKKIYVKKRKKYILSAIEIYKNTLKVWNKHQTTYKIAINRLLNSYDWKLVSDNMWYLWSKLICEGESNGMGIREFPRSLYGNSGKQTGIATILTLQPIKTRHFGPDPGLGKFGIKKKKNDRLIVLWYWSVVESDRWVRYQIDESDVFENKK